MKKKILSCFMILIGCLLFTSCNQDPVDKNNSIFPDTPIYRSDFDMWLMENYTNVYNLSFRYKFEDIESDTKYNLVPSKLSQAEKMAQIVKHVWFSSYDELLGVSFMKKYSPRVLFLVGSAAYNADQGTRVLGTAEGGLKVTLYEINNLEIDPELLKEYYFHTMHHEFAHILHQTKNYDPSFEKISASNYISGEWHKYSMDTFYYRSRGFASAYSMQEANEDWVELYAFYVTNTKEWWEDMINSGGEEGRKIFDKKMEIVKNYYITSWGLNIDSLRSIVLRRNEELLTFEFKTFNQE